MNIQIKLEMLLLLNVLTGSILYTIWHISARILSKHQTVQYLYYGLKLVILSFLVPFMYVCLYLHFRHSDGSWEGYFMEGTPAISRFSIWAGIIWAAGALAAAVRYGRRLYLEWKVRKSCRRENGDAALVLEKLCRHMKIRKQITIFRGTENFSPSIGGLFHTRLYLGSKEYDEEELRIILRHELIHYQHGDIRMRRLLLFLGICCWFHPLFITGKIHEDYRRWSEDYNDESICRVENMDRYIYTLLKVAVESVEAIYLTQAMVTESRCDVLRRIENMKNFEEKKKLTHFALAVWSAVCMLSVGTTVYASGIGVVEGYEILAKATDVGIEVEMDPIMELEEYTVEEDADSDIIEEKAPAWDISRSFPYSIDWTVGAKVRMVSSEFQMNSGDTISISALLNPDDLTVDIGIINPDNTRTYVSGSDSVYHKFTVSQSGTYKVFVQNSNSKEVRVTGACR